MQGPRPDDAIVAHELRRVFRSRRGVLRSGAEIVAVDGISFRVPRGTIFGLLGPNGAGKTTTIKMLSTLLVPTSGTAQVGGYDVRRDERAVRRRLGVVLGGERGLYWKLSARDNLITFGRLYGLSRRVAARRADELLELVGLRERASERVEGFSRGMKQRLHLAKALIHDPPVLFLDEPSIGLDPVSAVAMRAAIGALVPDHTVLLTTHDMHEADQLCREIAIVDHGRIVAQGTPAELKARAGTGRRLVVLTDRPLNGTAPALQASVAAQAGVSAVEISDGDEGGTLTVECLDPAAMLDVVLDAVRQNGVELRGVRVLEPTLEDAFIAIAGGRLA